MSKRASPEGYRRGKQRTTKRQCLRCDKDFQSEGNHNRLCGQCHDFFSQNPSAEVSHALVRTLKHVIKNKGGAS